jgi:4-amino-4-deoxy-L-arabinose transferase-like glycosyltransferase
MRHLPGIVDRLRWFVLSAAILCLAAFNLGFRQHTLPVHQWDESLYATTAWEMLQSGELVGTTFNGTLDYYNSKPPLNVWLIALSFKWCGVNLVSLRLPSLLAGFSTIALILFWGRRVCGDRGALVAGLVMATLFGFLYNHAARRANTDAINTLLIVLVVATLWAARARPWRLVWLGPVLAAVFLLRGMAILLPIVIIVADEWWTFGIRRRGRWAPTWAAAALFALPVGAWIVARWQIDQWQFLSRLFWYDFVARTLTPIEDHPGSVLFYLDVLQKQHYEWLVAVAIGAVLSPGTLTALRSELSGTPGTAKPARLLVVWAGAALLIPTIVSTKMSWYLQPFYPVFAIGAGALFAHGLQAVRSSYGWGHWKVRTLVGAVVLAVCVAECRIVWYACHLRPMERTAQGLMLAERDRLRGKHLYRRRLDRGEIFVLHAMVGGTHRLVPDAQDFLRQAKPGDFYLTRRTIADSRVALIRTQGELRLYERAEDTRQ